MRRGAAPPPFVASLFIVGLLCSPACAFLYARSELLSPPASNFVSLAVVNASAHQAVIFNEAFEDSTLHLTFTSGFLSSDRLDYAIVTRPVLLRRTELVTVDIFIDLSMGGLVWALFDRPVGQCTARAISLLNASVVREIDIPVDGSHKDWRMVEQGDGFLIPVVANDSNICWLRTNGSLACIDAPFSVWGVVPDTDTLLALSVAGSNVTVLRTQLSSEAPAASASPTLLELSNSLTRTFLFTVNSTLALLLLPDPQTLALTVTPLRANLSGQVDRMKCGPTAVSTQYMAWVAQYDASIRHFLLDLTTASLVPLTFHSPFSYLINMAVSSIGDVILASCDSGDIHTSCQLQWFPAFNASASPDSVLDMPFSSQIAGYDTATQPLPDVAVLSTITPTGFVVLRLGNDVGVLAWITVGIVSRISAMAVDPHSLAILFLPRSVSLYVIDWAASSTLSAFTALLDDPLPDYFDAPVVLAPSYHYPHTYYASAQLADRETETFTLFVVSLLPVISLKVVINQSDTVYCITEDPTGATLFVASATGVHQVGLTNASVLNTWAFPPDVPFWFEVLDMFLQPDLSRLYVFLVSDSYYSNASCAAIDLTDPARPMQLTVAPSVGGSLMDVPYSGHAVLSSGYLYFGFTATAGQIAKFDLDCNFLGMFTIPLPACGTPVCRRNPVISTPDAIVFAHAPNLYPIYLDCGLGSYRNLSSGTCETCPQGSVSSAADTQACMPCPTRTAPDSQRVSCLCSAGFYSTTDSANCSVCPVGGVCGGNNTLAPAPGYWRSNNSLTQFYACPYSAGCNGSDACAAGYEGVLCAVCARGHALQASQCLECADLASTATSWSVALVVYAALFILVLYAGPSSVSVLKSFVSFAQIVTFPTSGPTPRLLSAKLAPLLSKFFSLVNWQLLSIVSPDCLARRHVAYPVEAVATALLPVVTLLVIGGVLALPWQRVARLFRRGHHSVRPALAALDPFNEVAPDLAARLETYKQSGTPLRAMLFVVLLATPNVTRELASFFTCQYVSGASYMQRDFGVRCDSSLWRAYAAPVSILLALYGLGVPLVTWVLLVWFRHRLDLSFLQNAYRDECFWWELTEQGRKLCLLLLIAVLAPRLPGHYGPVSLAVSIVALAAHLQARPYKTSRDATFQTADLAGVILFFLWAVTPPEDIAADFVAWLYWVFAVLYTLASLAALLSAPAQRLFALLHSCMRAQRVQASTEPESELDALLVKRPRGD